MNPSSDLAPDEEYRILALDRLYQEVKFIKEDNLLDEYQTDNPDKLRYYPHSAFIFPINVKYCEWRYSYQYVWDIATQWARNHCSRTAALPVTSIVKARKEFDLSVKKSTWESLDTKKWDHKTTSRKREPDLEYHI